MGQRPTTLPLPLVGGSLKKARETGAFGPAFPGRRRSCPLSHGCRRASSPKGGSRVSSPPGVCRKPSLASPFGGRWCPVGTVQRLTEPAGESAPAGGGEGNPPPARTCAILLMSTSGASCPRRELPGVQPPRLESPGTGPQGRRWENEHLIKKARFYAGSIRCSGEHLKEWRFVKVLM